MKPDKYFFLILIAIVWSLPKCGPSVQTFRPVQEDLSAYETFAYLPNTNAEVQGKDYNNEKVNTAIIEAINANMKEEGYTLNRENPDLLILVSVKTDIETDVDKDPVYAEYPYPVDSPPMNPYYSPFYYNGWRTYTRFMGYDTETVNYKEGTVVIDMVDRESKRTVWKGITSGRVYGTTTSTAISLVNDVFDQYPLKKK